MSHVNKTRPGASRAFGFCSTALVLVLLSSCGDSHTSTTTREEQHYVPTGSVVNDGLIEAAAKGGTEAARIFLDQGADVNGGKNGATALWFAVSGGHLATAK